MSRDVYYGPGSDYHRRRQHLRDETLKCLECAVLLLGQPQSLLDAGCGEGAPIAWCRDRGIDALGIDLACPDGLPGYLRHNLAVPLSLARVYEWVLCWEVAEHLPAEAAATLCDTLSAHVEKPHGRLLFTAAMPGQSGPGHIHCQPQSYWRHLFYVRGLSYQRDESAVLREAWLQEAPRAPWYGRNVQSFAWA